jgi:hypothetical protein
MKRFPASHLKVLLLPLAFALSCGGMQSTPTTNLQAKLLHYMEDDVLVDCATGESLWVDIYTLRPWWNDMTVQWGDPATAC